MAGGESTEPLFLLGVGIPRACAGIERYEAAVLGLHETVYLRFGRGARLALRDLRARHGGGAEAADAVRPAAIALMTMTVPQSALITW